MIKFMTLELVSSSNKFRAWLFFFFYALLSFCTSYKNGCPILRKRVEQVESNLPRQKKLIMM